MRLMSPRQMRAFRGHTVAWCSMWLLMVLVVMAVFAELIANSNPIALKHAGRWYFPIVQNLTPSDLNIPTQSLSVDYKLLDEQPGVITLWTPVRYDAFESDRTLDKYPSAPDRNHLLGTDDRGRDVAARLLYGLRNSLIFALSVWFLSYVAGIFIGAVQGWKGGWFDFGIQRFIEIFTGIPFLFLVIILVSMIKPGMLLFIGIMTLFGWINISYYVRVEFLRLRKLEFVEAAQALGVPTYRLFLRHLLPNSLTPVITFSPFALTSNISALAALDYLGFGLPPPSASWGELLNQALRYFDSAWWLAVYPSLALGLTLLLLNFIGEGLRQALDPRSGS